MNKKFKKQFTVKNQTFEIQVELYSAMERRIGGRAIHTITVIHIGVPKSKFHCHYEFACYSEQDLVNAIQNKEEQIKRELESPVSKEEEALLKLNFEPIN